MLGAGTAHQDSVERAAERELRAGPLRLVFAPGDGKTHSTFLRNRIGFCVHHPLKQCAGKPSLVAKTNGRRERGVFPEFVSPHQPFRDLAAISHVMANVAAQFDVVRNAKQFLAGKPVVVSPVIQ